MHIIESLKDIGVVSNVELVLRERGKIIARRDGHNVFTVTGRNLLSKLLAWQTISTTDIPFTHRRTRWIGVGKGSQLEVTTVSSLVNPVLANSTDYLVAVQSAEFPTSTSVRFIKEFGVNEITTTPTPVVVTEAGLFADVNPANMGGTEDVGHAGPCPPNPPSTVLDPTSPSNAAICYKAFEGLTKTINFTLDIRWEFRF